MQRFSASLLLLAMAVVITTPRASAQAIGLRHYYYNRVLDQSDDMQEPEGVQNFTIGEDVTDYGYAPYNDLFTSAVGYTIGAVQRETGGFGTNISGPTARRIGVEYRGTADCCR